MDLTGDDLTRAANPNLTAGPNAGDELGELKRRVKKLEEAVAALQAVRQCWIPEDGGDKSAMASTGPVEWSESHH